MTGAEQKPRFRRLLGVYSAFGVAAVLAATIVHPGFYQGFAAGQMHCANRFVRIEAMSSTRLRFMWPRRHCYDLITITVDTIGHGERVLNVDMTSRSVTWGEAGGPLSAETLVRLIGPSTGPCPPGESAETLAAELVRVLESLHDGSFYPTRHHGYQVQEPFPASYQHFTCGLDLGSPGLWLWLALWPVCLFLCRREFQGLWFTLAKAYLLTWGAVAVIDGICIAVGMSLSPGPVAEGMEFLIGVVNIPALILATFTPEADIIGLDLPGLATGAAIWATVFSMGVAWFRLTSRAIPASNAQGPDTG